MIKDRWFALWFRLVSLLLVVSGFLAMSGVFSGGGLRVRTLAYYTMQSNVLAIVLFSVLFVRTATALRNSRTGGAGFFSRFEMVCVIDIMLTFIVFWVLLAPTIFTMAEDYRMWSFENLAVHAITPLLCLVDYILFSEPRHLKYRDVFFVVIFPLAYLLGTSLAGLMGYVYTVSLSDGLPVRFPYFFYDFDRIGLMSLAYIGAMLVFFLIVGHVFYTVDRKR